MQRYYSNLYEHAFNSVICLLDVLVIGGGVKMKSRHLVRPLAVALVYCAFTVVYTYLGGTDVLVSML